MRLIPRETKFFDMFEEIAGNMVDGARALTELLQDYDYERMPQAVERIKQIEHRGDESTRRSSRLSIAKTFTGSPLRWMTCWTSFTRQAIVCSITRSNSRRHRQKFLRGLF
jgi:hypothetical protein